MRTIEGMRRSGIGVSPECTIHEAAAIMEQSGVGALVVIAGDDIRGIVTDRDLVRRALARRVPDDARVDFVMSAPVVTVDADDDVHSVFAIFRTHALRRLAVVRNGRFVGMLTIDDLLIDIAADLADLVRPVTAEVVFGHRDAGLPMGV